MSANIKSTSEYLSEIERLRKENEELHRKIKSLEDSGDDELNSRQTLLNIIDNIPLGIFWKDKKANFLGMNLYAIKEVGVDNPEYYIGRSDYDVFPRELAERYMADDLHILQTGEPKLNYIEPHFLSDTHAVQWARTNKVPLKSKSGEIIGIVGTYEDITAQKKAEEEFKRISHELDQFFNVALEMLCISDLNGMFLRLNIAWEHNLGYTREELMSMPFLEFVHPDDISSTLEAVKQLSVEKPVVGFINRYRHKDGTYRWIEWKSAAAGNMIYAAASDITERKLMEEALKESEERYRLIAENSSDFIWCMDLKNKFTYVSPSVRKLRGFSPEEVMQQPIEKIMTPESISTATEATQKFREAAKNGNAYSGTILVEEYCKDGSTVNTEVSLGSIYGPDGKIEGLLGITRNVSERIIYENKLKKALEEAREANRAKSEFIANMSHEIRTPMNAILGFAELLRDRISDDIGKEYIEGIINGGETLLRLINDILDLSKIESGIFQINYEPVNIKNLLADLKQVFSFQAKKKNIELIFEVNPKIPSWLILDEIRIRQVLLNLLGNAMKFTNKGQINVAVEFIEYVSDSSKLDLYFAVKDTGIGISKDKLQRIFEAFYQQEGQNTRKYGGTGLGLAITKKLIEMMNGSIKVKSSLNKGSVFIVTLKNISIASAYNGEETKAEIDIPEVQNIIFNPSTILLVEDIESNRRIIKGFLEPFPFTILEAANGIEAFELAVKYRPDLILMDIQMNLMDGFESADLIRKRIPREKCPILALTALTLKSSRKEQLDLFDGIIQKPVGRQKLISILTKYLVFTSSPKETVETDTNQHNALNYVSQEQMEKLKSYFLPKIEPLIQRMPINTILKFAEELNTFGSENNIETLIEYCRELITATHSFDTNLIEMQLNKFENLISNFKAAE